MQMDVVFIRHGWSEGNEKRLLYGRLDVPLTETGKETLSGYREKYQYPETERYYSSPLLRCRQTFECLYPDKQLDGLLDGFIELSFGDAEGESEKLAGGYNEYFRRWSSGERLWNGETCHELRSRIDRALRDLLTDMYENGWTSATVVCHAGVIKSLLMNLGLMSPDFMSVFVHQGMGYRMSFDYDGANLMLMSSSQVPCEM